MKLASLAFVALASLSLVAGCNKTSSDVTTTSADTTPPAKPSTGAPVAFQVTSTSAKGIEVRAYNFSDKTVAQYSILIRYLDAGGKPVRVKVGTPFESDFARWSMSGLKYKCAAKSWCTFTIDPHDVPSGVSKTEVLAERVTALKADGIMFEEQPLFELPYADKWPG